LPDDASAHKTDGGGSGDYDGSGTNTSATSLMSSQAVVEVEAVICPGLEDRTDGTVIR
jgi:hypothetical protein